MSFLPRYQGTTGEGSAMMRRTEAEPELVYPSGGTVDYLATGAHTDGDFGLYRWNFGPNQSGPPPHFHKVLSESFYVLTGTIQFYDGTGWVDGHQGDFLHVPPGGLHGFRNVEGEPASMLLHFTPGTPREGYFEGLKSLMDGSWEPDEAELADFYAEYDNYWV